MSESAFCVHCGYDLRQDEPIERGALWMDPRGSCTWHGADVHLTQGEHVLLFSILKANGRFVATEVLNERIGYEGDHSCATVMICKVRRKLDAIAPNPIESEWRKGYRLKGVEP